MSGCVSGAALILILHAPLLEGLIGGGLALLIVYWQEFRLRELRYGLDEADRAKRQFLTNISHEIRTPLNAVQATAELLAGSSLSTEQREMTTVIQTNCESLVALIDEVLDSACAANGELRLEEVPFDLPAAVDSVAARMASRARAKGLAFEVEIQRRVPRHILGDPQRLRQVLAQLLDNAVKFTAEGKVRLEISAVDQPATALLFRVIDTGCGIDSEHAESLLVPFSQADSSAARRHGGIGLGLTLVSRLVALMGGSIGVHGRPGQGTTFWFLIPAHAAPGAPAATPEPAARTRHGRVLIVDDNPVNQMVAVRAVHRLGYDALVVSGGQPALEALAAGSFHLILMDCQMPGMDGYQTTEQIRAREAVSASRAHIPIVAMTANAALGEREKCLAAGMDDYLSKPVRLTLLERTLERWIAAPDPAKPQPAPILGPPVPVDGA